MSRVEIDFKDLSELCKNRVVFRSSHLRINKCVKQAMRVEVGFGNCDEFNCPYCDRVDDEVRFENASKT